MKKNHHTLAYKQQKQPNKSYKDLKQKHKMKIAEWMFRETCSYFKEHGELPEGDAPRDAVDLIYEKIKSHSIWVPYDEVYGAYLKKLPQYGKRIREDGLPEEQPQKEKGEKKKGNSSKRCPACGRKMKQQFIGLQHCKCGTSWKKDIGFFERTSDMVFVLERRKIGKKYKQRPAVHAKK